MRRIGAVLTLCAIAAMAAEAPPQAKPYPLTTCIVTGEALGSMGAAVSLVHAGQEVKFCCKGCIKDFKQDPAKYLKKLDQPAAGK